MAFGPRGSYPPAGVGYNRSGPEFQVGGTGSGMGSMAQGTSSLSQGVGSLASGWEPGPVYLIGLIIAEMIFFHVLGRILK